MKIENVAVIPLEEYEEYAKWKQLKDKPVIDYDRIKVGSVVNIDFESGKNIAYFNKKDYDYSKPFTLIYKDESYHLGITGRHQSISKRLLHNTFYQEGKFIAYSGGEDIKHYITEVISY